MTSKPSLTNCPSSLPPRSWRHAVWPPGSGTQVHTCLSRRSESLFLHSVNLTLSLGYKIERNPKDEDKAYQVAIAAGFHLFPSRTEKLSPRAPMVLHPPSGIGARFATAEALASQRSNPAGIPSNSVAAPKEIIIPNSSLLNNYCYLCIKF